jgi:hypothetical protein
MPAVIDKALDFIGGMNTSEPVPQSMDESTAKGILKYLKELGVPATPADVAERGQQQGWSAGFTDKVAEWAERVAAGERLVIKHPEFFSTYMRKSCAPWCNRRASIPRLLLNAFPIREGILADDKPVWLLCPPFCRVAASPYPAYERQQYQTVMRLAVGPRKRSAAGQP